MTALTQDRNTVRRDGLFASYPQAASTLIYAGALVCINTSTGYATKGATSTTLRAVGVSDLRSDNSAGAAGAVNVKVRRDGWFRFSNSASTDQVTLADVGADCYIVDDQTVAKTSATNTRSVAGKVRDVDADGVWIQFLV